MKKMKKKWNERLCYRVTAGDKKSETTVNNAKGKAAYSVYLVTITHNAGFAPTVSVVTKYSYSAATAPNNNFAARWGAAAVTYGDDKLLIHGGGSFVHSPHRLWAAAFNEHCSRASLSRTTNVRPCIINHVYNTTVKRRLFKSRANTRMTRGRTC